MVVVDCSLVLQENIERWELKFLVNCTTCTSNPETERTRQLGPEFRKQDGQ
jgi:hypothetical protein